MLYPLLVEYEQGGHDDQAALEKNPAKQVKHEVAPVVGAY